MTKSPDDCYLNTMFASSFLLLLFIISVCILDIMLGAIAYDNTRCVTQIPATWLTLADV